MHEDPIVLYTSYGGGLDGLLWRSPLFTFDGMGVGVVILHPDPHHGGNMHNNVVAECFSHLQNLEPVSAILRFNFNSASPLTPVEDLEAALSVLRQEARVAHVAIVGYSFGAYAAVSYLLRQRKHVFKEAKPLSCVTFISPPVSIIASSPMVSALRSLGCSGLSLSFVAGLADIFCAERGLREICAAVFAPSPELDLARGCHTQSSSSTSPAHDSSRVVDDDPNTLCKLGASDDQWLSIDLADVFSLSRIDVRWEAAYAQSYLIQGSSDGNAWTTMKSEVGREGWVATQLPLGSIARWVRIFGDKRSARCGLSITQVQIFSADEPGDVRITESLLMLPRCGHFYGGEKDLLQVVDFVAKQVRRAKPVLHDFHVESCSDVLEGVEEAFHCCSSGNIPPARSMHGCCGK